MNNFKFNKTITINKYKNYILLLKFTPYIDSKLINILFIFKILISLS